MQRWLPLRTPALALTVPALALAVAALAPAEAEAKGFVLITHGTSVMHYQKLTGAARALAAEATRFEVDVGYTYDHFGVFWLELWTWNGEYCLYQGDQVWALTPEEAAQLLEVEVGDLGKPFLYRFPIGLLILAVGAVGLGLWRRFSSDESPGIPHEPADSPPDLGDPPATTGG